MPNLDRFTTNVHKSLMLASYTITTLIPKKRKAIARFPQKKQQPTAIPQAWGERNNKEWGVWTTRMIGQ